MHATLAFKKMEIIFQISSTWILRHIYYINEKILLNTQKVLSYYLKINGKVLRNVLRKCLKSNWKQLTF